jgi:linoleate 10R-lipoxygenase
MTIPSENAVIMKNLGRYHDYSFDKPTRIPPRINLTSYVGAKYILERAQEFNVMWNEGFEHAMGKGGLKFMLAGDTSFHTNQREVMSKSIYRDEWHKAVKGFYEYQTMKLIKDKSCKIAGINQVDITRE